MLRLRRARFRAPRPGLLCARRLAAGRDSGSRCRSGSGNAVVRNRVRRRLREIFRRTRELFGAAGLRSGRQRPAVGRAALVRGALARTIARDRCGASAGRSEPPRRRGLRARPRARSASRCSVSTRRSSRPGCRAPADSSRRARSTRGGDRALRPRAAAAGSALRRLCALPSVPPRRLRPGALSPTHGKAPPPRGRALARRPAPLGDGRCPSRRSLFPPARAATPAAARRRPPARPRPRRRRARRPPATDSAAAPAALAPVAAAEETATSLENGALRARPSPTAARCSTSFVLPKYLDEQKRPLELVRAASRPSSAAPGARLPGRTRRDRGDRRRALRRREDLRPRVHASVTRTGSSQCARRSGSARLSLRRHGLRRRAGVPALGRPGAAQPDRSRSVNRYVMPATAVAATAGGGIDKVRAEKLDKAKREHAGRCPRRASPASRTTTSSPCSCPERASRARVVAVSRTDPAGKPPPTLAAAVDRQRPARGARVLRPEGRRDPRELRLGLERTVDFGWYGDPRAAAPVAAEAALTAGSATGASRSCSSRSSIRLLLFPLMHKSYASMKKMQKLAPKMNAIRDKYKKAKTDAAQRKKMNQELMALYQAEGYNPMSGCLPIAPAAADPRRVLQRALAVDRAAARAVRPLDQGPLGRRPHVRAASS